MLANLYSRKKFGRLKKLLFKIWPLNGFFKRRASYHFKAEIWKSASTRVFLLIIEEIIEENRQNGGPRKT